MEAHISPINPLCPRHVTDRIWFFYYPFDEEFPRVLIDLDRFREIRLPFNESDPWSSSTAPEAWQVSETQDLYWNFDLNDCTICQERIAETNASLLAVVLWCRHDFHSSCLANWLKAQKIRARSRGIFQMTCPNCRGQVSEVWFGGTWKHQLDWEIRSYEDRDLYGRFWGLWSIQFDPSFPVIENPETEPVRVTGWARG